LGENGFPLNQKCITKEIIVKKLAGKVRFLRKIQEIGFWAKKISKFGLTDMLQT